MVRQARRPRRARVPGACGVDVGRGADDTQAKFDVMPVGSSTAKKVEVKFTDFCCDEDEHDMAVSFVAPKPSALHQAAVRSVMERPNGLLYTQINAALEQFVTDFKSK